MKRIGYIYEKMAEWNNIVEAESKSTKRKTMNFGVKQHIKNRTFGDYARPSLRNLLLCASIGILRLLQFIGVKAGEPLVPPEMRYISFAVMMASTIFFSTLVGVFLGEWKGTSARTKSLLVLGTVVLIASFCAISLGSK